MTTTNETVVSVKHETIAQALVAFQAETKAITKDTANPYFKSKYADLPSVVEQTRPLLTKHGLAVIQEPSYVIAGENDTVVDVLWTRILHADSDDQLSSSMVLRPVKNDPQAQGSAITYARRYAYMAILGLVADDDDDGNAASGRSSSGKPAARAGNAKPAGAAGPVAFALNEVKSAVAAAGATSKDAVAYFKEHHKGDLLTSTDLDALNATVAHFKALGAVQGELGGKVVE